MHRPSNQSARRGFTLIELLFAMSFVSVLLIIILTSTLQITRIYNKGITLKQVDQSGQAIATELQSSLGTADAPINTASVQNGAGTGGRLCLGNYSYVWNLKGSTANQYQGDSTPIGLVKVSDTTKAMCAGTPTVPKDRATELILGAQGTSGVQLELRDFALTQVAESGANYLYKADYTVSTNDQTLIAADPSGKTEACAGGAGDEFCALNSFSVTVLVRQGGSGSSD